jgi:glycosyltransferase involved in cell wall biosynthesis
MISKSAEISHNFLSTSKAYSVITPSRWLSEKFELAPFINPDIQIKTIPNIVSMDQGATQIKSQDAETKFLFVTASASASNKGLEEVIAAIKQLSEAKPELLVTLEIAGVENLQFEGNHSNFRIKCLGNLSQNEMKEVYSRSDALIVASKSENSPNVIPEAQLQNVVVIANAVGGIPEIIQNGKDGFLYGLKKKTLLSALINFVELPELEKLRIRSQARGSAIVRHNTTQILEETLGVYRELIGRDRE